jgi:hypothetical protein
VGPPTAAASGAATVRGAGPAGAAAYSSAAAERLAGSGGSGAWNPTATKQRALKDALRNQVVNKKPGTPAAAAAAAGRGGGLEDGGAEDGAAEPSSPAPAPASAAPAEPGAKLGRLPKNARLIEAMAQHKNAKPKPKGWLMAVVDSIYKEGEWRGALG